MEFERYGSILKPDEEIGAIFNCGAIEYKGDIYLLPRVIKNGHRYENYISEIWLAKSKDGKNFTLTNELVIKPDKPYDNHGCEDPRITRLDDEYFITYTALSEPASSGKGYRIGLASTKDFSKVEKQGIIGPNVNDKDTVIFPDKINGKIAVLHRIEPDIQIIYFDDIEQLKENHDYKFWEKYLKELDKYIVLKRKHGWESEKIGVGPPPIKTEEGWLLIYHSVDKNKTYRIGGALLDLDNPQKVIAHSSNPILEPKMEYERIGDVSNVIFPEGTVVKGNELLVYYGAADKTCCLATCKLDELIDSLLEEK